MRIDVHPAAHADKQIISNLMQLYQHDFTEFERADVDEQGRFSYPLLDLYWTEGGRYPYLVRVDGKIAGFVLVADYSYLGDSPGTKAIAEFFIMRAYRRRGVGAEAARSVFRAHPGSWEIAELPTNPVAQAFWRSVITRFTGGAFEEFVVDNERWRGPIQRFESPAGPSGKFGAMATRHGME